MRVLWTRLKKFFLTLAKAGPKQSLISLLRFVAYRSKLKADALENSVLSFQAEAGQALLFPQTLALAPPRDKSDPKRLCLHWIIPDFAAGGSGGHLNIFRMIRWLERFGHHSEIWIQSGTRHVTPDAARDIARKFYCADLEAPFHVLSSPLDAQGIRGDAVIATDRWTAYPARAVTQVRHRFYFVQDYESLFYPMGSNYLLTDQTYGFGYTCITAGKWLERLMRERFGAKTHSFDLAHDPSLYFPRPELARQKGRIVFYGRIETPRRAVELGLMALDLVHRRFPDIHVDFFGWPQQALKPAYSHHIHHTVAATDLADMYRRASLGVVFSATNHSLVPHEMMGCGLPVIDLDLDTTRSVFPNDVLCLAPAHPHGIADAISGLLANDARRLALSQAGHSYAAGFSWQESARKIEQGLLAELC